MEAPKLDPLTDLRLKIAEEYTRKVKPLYPRIVIRVLGGELMSERIIIPDGPGMSKQNRPVYEGVVLEVFEPTYREIDKKQVLFKPSVQPGDHVIFPHWSGDQKGLREREGAVRYIPDNEIIGVVEYKRKKGTERAVTTSGGKR